MFGLLSFIEVSKNAFREIKPGASDLKNILIQSKLDT